MANAASWQTVISQVTPHILHISNLSSMGNNYFLYPNPNGSGQSYPLSLPFISAIGQTSSNHPIQLTDIFLCLCHPRKVIQSPWQWRQYVPYEMSEYLTTTRCTNTQDHQLNSHTTLQNSHTTRECNLYYTSKQQKHTTCV
jgi:hypothetical protein